MAADATSSFFSPTAIALGIVVIIGIFAIGATITRRARRELRALEEE